jgi:hypothetical protein
MSFKKHNWSKYGHKGILCRIELSDEDGRQLDRMSWNASDKDAERRIFTILKNGYGVFKKNDKKYVPEETAPKKTQLAKDMEW